MKDYVDKLVEIKIRGYEYFIGVFINYGKEWVIIRNISGDYIIDGFKIINRKFIVSISLINSEPLKTIVKLKHLNFVYKLDYDLNNTVSLIRDIKKNGDLIFVLLANEDMAFVGFVDEIHQKSLNLRDLTSKGEMSGFVKNYKFDKIRIIETKTDYLDSLEIYLKYTQKG
ncbi:hypothetical protein [Flavobacterium pectinovorum]|uniref:Uncharacterized protein n=1 Tax=Flavobacterium pectinovorum TaxID=29533 RepID=A0A502EKT8_9FLAO|nr:hypothetical protein [Flavobacterium pectinovorum]TPG37734.1 hypothetical protein EAH81_17535 [Flavobacterium pectinovorum]